MITQIKETIENAENGNIQLLDALIELKENKKELETILAEIKEFEKKYIIDLENQILDYPDGYKGYDIKVVNGRQMFSYKNISEWSEVEKKKKDLEKKYKSLYMTYQSTNERPMSEDGVIYDLPEVNYGSSYVKLEKKR